MRNFRKLRIWLKAIELCESIYKCTDDYPKVERYNLSSQMRRASVSVPSNIAEGCRGSNKELIYFLNIAMGSLFELETQLEISVRVLKLKRPTFKKLITEIDSLQKSISSLRNTLK